MGSGWTNPRAPRLRGHPQGAQVHSSVLAKIRLLFQKARGGVLDFGLDGGVPPGPRDPNPCLEVKKVPMFRDFAQKMDPFLGIF